MKKIFRFFFLVTGLLFFNQLLSQNDSTNFKLTGELRFRGELDHGYKKLPLEEDHVVGVISQRSRIAASLQKKFYDAKISLQYVMMWGGDDIASKTGVWGDSVGVNLNEAWVKMKFNQHLSLTAGRQYFKYDDQRLLAWRNWNQFSLSYDALKLSYTKSDWQLDLGLSWNNVFNKLFGKDFGTNNYYRDGNRIKSLNFLYLKKQFEGSYISFLTIASGVQKTSSKNAFRFKYTFGPYLFLQLGATELKLSSYYQGGLDAYDKRVNAFMLSGEAAYKTGNLKAGAGIDLISGNDPSSHSTNERNDFDLLYGARFKYNGWMNQFGYLPKDTHGAGLIDIYPNVSLDVGNKSNFKLYYHFFYLQQKLPVINNIIVQERSLGSELDLMYSLKIRPDIQMSTGFSYFFTTPTIEAIKLPAQYGNELGSPFWGWIMLTVKPRFY